MNSLQHCMKNYLKIMTAISVETVAKCIMEVFQQQKLKRMHYI